jgi:hypothetical protein
MFRGRIFNAAPMYSQSQVNLMNQLNKLWLEHVYWTRMFIVSNANDLADLQHVTNRLLENLKDFAAVFAKYYGQEIANRFEKLFTDHLVIAARLVNQAKAGVSAAVNQTRKEWYANADEIAKFLAEINPNWGFNEWKSMLHTHLMLTENEATQILTDKFEMSINTFDEVENQALLMADIMFKGLIRQFNIQ